MLDLCSAGDLRPAIPQLPTASFCAYVAVDIGRGPINDRNPRHADTTAA